MNNGIGHPLESTTSPDGVFAQVSLSSETPSPSESKIYKQTTKT